MKLITSLYIFLWFNINISECQDIRVKFDIKPAFTFLKIHKLILLEKSKRMLDSVDSKYEVHNKFYRNKMLENMVDSLLKLPIYNTLQKLAIAKDDTVEYRGNNAYKYVLLSLPYKIVNMNGMLAEQWLNKIDEEYINNAIFFLDSINNNQDYFNKTAIGLCKSFLPSVNFNTDIVVIFCIDGNRGCFTINNTIVIDLLDFNTLDFNVFIKLLSHELHHVLYSKWLEENYNLNNATKNNTCKAVLQIQDRIIKEGIAQQINFSIYPAQIKKLYYNKKLINELFNYWMQYMNNIAENNSPLDYYRKWNQTMWDNSMHLLKKYCVIKDELIPHRPTVDYYISYNLYKAIYNSNGIDGLKLVINNPELLLEEYNRIWNNELPVPTIPMDIVNLWKINLLVNKQP